jgi:hypothetical protein
MQAARKTVAPALVPVCLPPVTDRKASAWKREFLREPMKPRRIGAQFGMQGTMPCSLINTKLEPNEKEYHGNTSTVRDVMSKMFDARMLCRVRLAVAWSPRFARLLRQEIEIRDC